MTDPKSFETMKAELKDAKWRETNALTELEGAKVRYGLAHDAREKLEYAIKIHPEHIAECTKHMRRMIMEAIEGMPKSKLTEKVTDIMSLDDAKTGVTHMDLFRSQYQVGGMGAMRTSWSFSVGSERYGISDDRRGLHDGVVWTLMWSNKMRSVHTYKPDMDLDKMSAADILATFMVTTDYLIYGRFSIL